MSKDKYFISDIETGYKYEVSKKAYEAYWEAWDYFRLKVFDSYKGLPIIFGTSGALESAEDYKKFYEQI